MTAARGRSAAALVVGLGALSSAGCQAGGGHATLLQVQDDAGYTYCAQANEDGSATFALSRVHNSGDDAVVGVTSVELIDADDALSALGAYFVSDGGQAPRSGSAYVDPGPADGSTVGPDADAWVAIGVRLDGSDAAEATGATVTYETADGETGSFTTRIAMQMVPAGGTC